MQHCGTLGSICHSLFPSLTSATFSGPTAVMSSIRTRYTRPAIPALSQLTWVRSIASSASLCLTLLLLLISILPVASAENRCNSPEHVLSKQRSSRDWQLPTWLEFRCVHMCVWICLHVRFLLGLH